MCIWYFMRNVTTMNLKWFAAMERQNVQVRYQVHPNRCDPVSSSANKKRISKRCAAFNCDSDDSPSVALDTCRRIQPSAEPFPR